MRRTTRRAPSAPALSLFLLAPMLPLLAGPLHASGTLTPKGSPNAPIEVLDHHVEVSIHDGFARTEVTQAFFNPNATDLEAVYSFPVPRSASLAEMTIFAGERELHGEVVAEDEARRVYEETKKRGDDAGLAEKSSYLTYEFLVARVPAQDEARFRFVYYQPLEIDTGIGRYVYPLEEGGTDDAALAFWDTEREVKRSFSFHLTLRSVVPVDEVRMPGFEAAANVQSLEEGWWEVSYDAPGGVSLDRDLVVYYRLAEGLPGRVELVPFRDDPNGPGTFMLVLTPGIDLAPLARGSDWVFVLDVSGSMEGKLHTLVDGVVRAMGELRPEDRFEVITFSTDARSLTGGRRSATRENVEDAVRKVRELRAGSGTNLYAPLALALKGLDADRATSLVLVTDAVANAGELDPARFHDLMKSHDVRVFGMLLGNSANWPLMRTICDASGGFYAGISNADDVVGQILLAKSKVTHECLHDAAVRFDGVPVHDVTEIRSKVYRGQQLVLFGRYAEPGPLEVRLEARLTGEDRVYRATTTLPALDTETPELERLWALDRIEEIEARVDHGALDAKEGEHAIADLGVAYQVVTDHTSMLVVDDAVFAENGIERRNRDRVAAERKAHAQRTATAPRVRRVDAAEPAFPSTAPTTRGGSGMGAIDPWTCALGLLVALALCGRARRSTS